MQLDWDAIVVTRNRPEALVVSLPLLLAQSRPPARLIVIDASDDHAAVAEVVRKACEDSAIPVHLEHAEPSATAQRNRGFALGDAAVAVFPDDDSLFYPDAAERLLEIYERDAAEHAGGGEGLRVAAVCGQEVEAPPPGAALPRYVAPRPKGFAARLRGKLRFLITQRAAGFNPLVSVGNTLGTRVPAPAWLQDFDAVKVPYMTGFRMSFRRDVLSEIGGFDETLSRYAWFEDQDASFAAARHGLVVAAHKARIRHHRFPGPRGDGKTIGLWAVLNRTYVVMKHARANPDLFSPGREAWRLRIYMLGRVGAYCALGLLRGGWARQRASGAISGFAGMGALLTAPAERLAAVYSDLTGVSPAPTLRQREKCGG